MRSGVCGQNLVSGSIMAGELTLPVELGALLRVRVVDDAVPGAGDYLLIVGVGHELRTEDVCTMARTYRLLNLEERSKRGWRGRS